MSLPAVPEPVAGRASRRTPLLVMGLILLLSLAAALVISGFVQAQQQGRFERETQAYTLALKDRMNDYDSLLRTARAAWQVHPDLLNEAEFARFVDGIDLARRYPGVQALAFGVWLPDGDSDALTARLRRTVRPDYTVRPDFSLRGGESARTARVPVSVIAPASAENLGALGFDLYSEPVRRTALDRARQRVDLQASGRTELLQKDEVGRPLPGFLLALPVWRTAQAEPPEGFLVLVVRADQFLAGLGPPGLEDRLSVSVRLDDQPLTGAVQPGYFRDSAPLMLAGQPWTLTYAAPRSFGQDAAAGVPVLVMLAGLLIAGLAYLLVGSQVLARSRAETLNISLGRARAQQEQARAEFEAIFQSMQDAAAFTGPQGQIRLVNRALERQFGYPASALIGQPLSALHLDARLKERQTFQALTTPYRRADGSVFSGEAQRSAVQDAGGERLGLLEVVRDVSERVSAEQAVVRGERRYRGVLDAIPHILQVSDGAGRVTYSNTQHRDLLGGNDLSARMTPEGRAASEQLWQEVRERGEVGQYAASAEVQLQVGGELATSGGSRRWFTLRLSPIRIGDGSGGSAEEGHDGAGQGTADQGTAGQPELVQTEEWITSATDIHDRLTAERRAQRGEERYRSVLEGLPQIVWQADPQGESLAFNRRWEEYVGQERAYGGFLGLLHPDDRADYQRGWAAAIRSGRPFEAEHRLLSAEGRYRNFVTRGLPVLDPAGTVLEWVGTSTDVDDSVYEENAARLLADVAGDLATRRPEIKFSPTRPHVMAPRLMPPYLNAPSRPAVYRAALGRLTARFAEGAALWLVRAEPVQTEADPSESVNAQGQESRLPELLASSSLHSAWQTGHMRAFLDGLLGQVIRSEDPLFVPSHPLLHGVNATGALLYPLLGAGGRLCGVLGLFYRQELTGRDHDLAQEISGRFAAALDNDALQERVAGVQRELQALNLSLEDRVQRRTEELEHANQELEAFSYSVSHDLRTPLRHIVGFGDLLGKELLNQQTRSEQEGAGTGGGLSAKGQRYLSIITDSAGRMSQLIDDLLEFSRMGRQELRRESVDLRALLQTGWEQLEPDREGRHITLTLPDTLPPVPGDAGLLALVATNLLSNAIKYTRTREHATIDVSARVDAEASKAGAITLTVRDNGVGFNPEYLDKLFGVFQRLHRADEFEGIGIGLANVRRIVTRHGGRVGADARQGEWAEFWITLPLDAGELTGPPTTGTQTTTQTTAQKTANQTNVERA